MSYVFDAPEGKVTLAQMFDGRSQLFVKHFMMGPVIACVTYSTQIQPLRSREPWPISEPLTSRGSILCQHLNIFSDLTWAIVFLNQLGHTYHIYDVSLLFPCLFCNYQTCLLANFNRDLQELFFRIFRKVEPSRGRESAEVYELRCIPTSAFSSCQAYIISL